jgi:ribosome-associated protein
MNTEQLKDLIIFELEERKAENIKVLDVKSFGMASYMIFASGRSSKNVSSIAEIVSDNIKDKTGMKVALQGLRNSNWAVLDVGDIIVHVFHPETREYYNVEGIFESGVTNKA